ncbi:uncharacterized protein TNIN_85041 [Trichonephila inaurata madagascariensis]|uniref:Uncharacterized protein n=1 Tax=Trichonephila inaurata madagascariensis TaxID=2747483 RepID=A0A8X6MM76_9ARAC|nr:uncharacterized protein TNIN_85041 [Trichonephila inaurata madagascariensis]
MKNPSYWVLNCNPHKPTEKIWKEQTSHRIDYPPKGLKHSSKANHRKSNVKFTGKMETISSGMRDYTNIQPVDYKDKDNISSRCFKVSQIDKPSCCCGCCDCGCNTETV